MKVTDGVGPALAYTGNVMRSFLCLGLELLVHPSAGAGLGTIRIEDLPW